ncbi:MAG: hypothetical protein MJ097_00525 [Dorea sp.]|nr:hypothetical protein [Dorea sp.]
MTLGEAITHLEEILSDPEHDWGCDECKKEHEQLLAWLKELKKYREDCEWNERIMDEDIKG